MTSDTRETIMALARLTVQAHGYNGLSFRELAKAVGIKSASIHYHFPTKGDLGAALARRYWQDAQAHFESIGAESQNPTLSLRKYTEVFRRALENDNRMCLCGFMAAEYHDLPEAVKVEVQAFADVNISWLTKLLSSMDSVGINLAEERAFAIFAAITGAQLTARSRADVSLFDRIVENYRRAGLIPT
ncbi:TetR/AcrR family transcriptional regulator [Rhizorhapis suberifaciens]|uniref:TetR/AcrR family transcriptional repressor of nem operon n=1 Tax=Rhizorhapis suberifaciens TaxID=13656 RepID=A0A840HS08_9SPHN|nr:TetR/AcrR family transcriptional regulator [Rhizorhapis suberifaciens]MBB4640370.1 TetR/AcrR family transcriptional repressor of nem operon [Rhizorhapis suberifaciens]